MFRFACLFPGQPFELGTTVQESEWDKHQSHESAEIQDRGTSQEHGGRQKGQDPQYTNGPEVQGTDIISRPLDMKGTNNKYADFFPRQATNERTNVLENEKKGLLAERDALRQDLDKARNSLGSANKTGEELNKIKAELDALKYVDERIKSSFPFRFEKLN